MATTTMSPPRVRKSRFGVVDLEKQHEWLKQHKHEYIGQWVVLDGDRLVGYGDNPVPIVEQARAEGVRIPFVELIRDDSEPFCGAWL
ncbi:MAG: DUF5678 domain-containing protein [Blastocatellia bacterium]